MKRLTFIGGVVAAILLTACGQAAGSARPTSASPTPTLAQGVTPAAALTGVASPKSGCTPPASLTPAVTEGPYFKAGSPERALLLDAGVNGIQLVITGFVFTPECKPVVHALVDFWQADSKGNYDNTGYTLRGHQFTDAAGRYQLTSVMPGLYPGRTEHIHVKAQAPNGPLLTTQLYFPGATDNSSDSFFDARLLLNVENKNGALAAAFNFVVRAQ